ncbi:MAG: SET domain-containing protein-lysine N-methyltransferase [Sinobacteraceae bacterium]|nr:SET domain-containing protein-lysine N-methyltransferase [Nevskiaceae bacterium]
MTPASTDSQLIEVRRSDVHGLGVFALQPISKGTRIIEYLGERVTHAEADRRYESKDVNDSHTFLFIVDGRTVIDAGVDGNDARFFNHSCDPNCESVVEKRRVYIEAIRDVGPGEELTYDYQIQREDDDPENIDEVFACRCGFANCRGTMLWPTERKARRKARSTTKRRSKSERQSSSKSRAGSGSKSRSRPGGKRASQRAGGLSRAAPARSRSGRRSGRKGKRSSRRR